MISGKATSTHGDPLDQNHSMIPGVINAVTKPTSQRSLNSRGSLSWVLIVIMRV